jgi:hypothetical protein
LPDVGVMSDKVFERSLSGLTMLVLLWIILGIIFKVIGWGWVVMSGLVIEIIASGLLLHYGARAIWRESSI